MATATVVTILAGFLLFARPATYTATALVAGVEASVPALTSADRLARLAAALKETPELRLRRAARPDAPTIEAELQAHFEAGPHSTPGWTALRFSHEEPAIAALTVNTAARLALSSRRSGDDDGLLRDLESAERALQAFDQAHPDIRASGPTTGVAEETAHRSRLEAVDEEIDALQRRLDALTANDSTPVEARPGVVRVRQALDRAIMEQTALARRYGPRHERMIAATGAVDAARRLLAEQLGQAREQIERDLDAQRARRETLLGEATARAERQRDRSALLDEREGLRLVLEQTRRRFELTDDSSDAVAEALPPLSPDLPRELPWLAALFLAVALATTALQVRRT